MLDCHAPKKNKVNNVINLITIHVCSRATYNNVLHNNFTFTSS